MLQSVPDPFDSYGPPQAEDQIFSILAPLSIMTGMSTTASSPMAGTPEPDGARSLPSSASTKISSWLPATSGVPFTAETTAWAGATSPLSSPPRSTSPPAAGSMSPPNGSTTPRRHSVPGAQRKAAEASKLRSMLSAIEEARAHTDAPVLVVAPGAAAPPALTSTTARRPDPLPDMGWNFTYGLAAPYDGPQDGERTPRSSTLFASEGPPLPPPPSTTPPDSTITTGGAGADAPDDRTPPPSPPRTRTPTPT